MISSLRWFEHLVLSVHWITINTHIALCNISIHGHFFAFHRSAFPSLYRWLVKLSTAQFSRSTAPARWLRLHHAVACPGRLHPKSNANDPRCPKTAGQIRRIAITLNALSAVRPCRQSRRCIVYRQFTSSSNLLVTLFDWSGLQSPVDGGCTLRSVQRNKHRLSISY